MKQGRRISVWISLLCAAVVILFVWAIRNPDFRLTPHLRAAAYNNRAWEHAVSATTNEEYKQALADCDKAIVCDPKLVNSYDTRAYIYAKLGRYQDAAADIKYVIAKNADTVLNDWNGGISEYPKNAYSYALRGLVYLELNDSKNADKDLAKALQLNPNCAVKEICKWK